MTLLDLQVKYDRLYQRILHVIQEERQQAKDKYYTDTALNHPFEDSSILETSIVNPFDALASTAGYPPSTIARNAYNHSILPYNPPHNFGIGTVSDDDDTSTIATFDDLRNLDKKQVPQTVVVEEKVEILPDRGAVRILRTNMDESSLNLITRLVASCKDNVVLSELQKQLTNKLNIKTRCFYHFSNY